MKFSLLSSLSFAVGTLGFPIAAHDAAEGHGAHDASPVPLPFVVELKGPISVPKSATPEPGTRLTGQGFWKFQAARDLVPVPAAAASFVKGAHGTVVFDAPRDTVYWGLKGVGFVAFSNRLSQSWVVQGDPALAKGNIHGADVFQRRGQPPLIAAADNEEGRVHVTDGTFARVQDLGIPPLSPYADGRGFAPTDAAFTGPNHLWVTDGYGKAYFMPASLDPLRYSGEFFGGKSMSQTPHGITYDARRKSLLISARYEGRIMDWNMKRQAFDAVDGLPSGSTVCDVDLWGDYALAPCLHDNDKTKAGPIFIVNLKKHAVVATLRPKEDLGYADAQSIHGACWYFTGEGRKQEVYVVFTSWNPGGIGALKLVGPTE
jgi:hypothetical protein